MMVMEKLSVSKADLLLKDSHKGMVLSSIRALIAFAARWM